MPDEALQTAFEIKTTCDEISRKLLRWHWENKPGEHSLGALLDHIRTRQQESPEYYDRLPDLAGRNSWQQLDTTLCMRVLLDPEKDAAHQLDLLGNTEHPAAARRACNAVRTARNEAAHASDRTAAAQAAILFNEAVEALEEGYAGAPLRTSELGQYYRLAEDYLSRCGAKKPIASAAPEEKAPRAAKSGQSTAGRKKVVKRIFAEEFVVVRRDPSKVQFVARLNDFYSQFQKLANNYNQIVKAVNSHFSNVTIPHQIAALEQRTRELKTLSIEILNLAKQAKEWLRI